MPPLVAQDVAYLAEGLVGARSVHEKQEEVVVAAAAVRAAVAVDGATSILAAPVIASILRWRDRQSPAADIH